MSKLVAFAAIQGGYNIVSMVEGEYKRALETFDASTEVGFPNTATSSSISVEAHAYRTGRGRRVAVPRQKLRYCTAM